MKPHFSMSLIPNIHYANSHLRAARLLNVGTGTANEILRFLGWLNHLKQNLTREEKCPRCGFSSTIVLCKMVFPARNI